MLHIVQISLSGAELVDRMGQMRTWLDHMRCQPGVCRVTSEDLDGCRVRVDFTEEMAARAFAQAFGGRLLENSAA